MRYAAQQDDSLAGLEEDRRGSLPRGGRRWTGSLSQRARASRGLPQAVFKISSYSHSAGAVWDRVKYVSREGELEAEGPNGEMRDQEQLERTVEDWNRETAPRARRQYAMSAVVSFPQGVDEEKATEAARQFFREAFADNHDYVFAAHTDAKQFHLHIVVQSAGHDGKQLRIRRDDLQDLRMLLAEKAAEQGIELDASPRWARGLDAERRPGREAEGIRRRGETPRRKAGEAWQPEKELREEQGLSPDRRMQLEALVDVRRQRWERGEKVAADEYVEAAALLARKIGELGNNQEKVAAVKGAAELAGAGLERGSSFQMPGLVSGAERVDKVINSQIRGLGGGAEQHAAITARRGLAEKISEYHQGVREQAGQERTEGQESAGPGRGRGAEGRRESAGAGRVCQAVEYARSAAGVTGQINKLTNDPDRVGAVKEAVHLARFGWELAQKDKGTAEEREQARAIIDKTERALRFVINRIEDPQAQRAAIQARQTLYKAGLKEYREEKRAD